MYKIRTIAGQGDCAGKMPYNRAYLLYANIIILETE